MRIVIDMQGAQTESRLRGIGRYTMSFAKAVVSNREEHDIILALSGLFPETIEPIRAFFSGLLPQNNIRVWYAPSPVCESEAANEERRKTAEILREAFLASLNPDIIHITSLFEGYVDDAVTSNRCFDWNTPISITLYDLIPLLNSEYYLKSNPSYERYYMRKIEYLRQASLCFSISASSAKEITETLGFNGNNAINISTAVDSLFCEKVVDETTIKHLYLKFGICSPFILYTGGADERKNLPRLIEAFSMLTPELRQQHQLVFAGKMSASEINRLRETAQSMRLGANGLVFTGYINDEELVQLYNLCKLYVFPSWHEGFGLPALEAMSCGCPVIGANTSSLPEVIGFPDALFDPFDVTSISQKMTQALQDETFRDRLYKHGLEQAKKFSWDKTAQLAITAWEDLLREKSAHLTASTAISSNKLKLAFVSPLPPEQTGIADYSAELLPALAQYYEIVAIVTQDRIDKTWTKDKGIQVRDVDWFRANANVFDRVIYQVGNSAFHQHMLQLLREIPGIVVLHDFYLSGLMSWMECAYGSPYAWVKSLYTSHGYGAVKTRYEDPEDAKKKYPVNSNFLQLAQGVIVHSEHSRKLSRQWYTNGIDTEWKVIPMLGMPIDSFDKTLIRKQLGFTEQDFLVCSFGFLDPTKLNHRLLYCWLQSTLAQDENSHLIFVGENHGGDYGANLLQIIQASPHRSRIHITGFTELEVFHQYLIAADMAVQLRTMSRGETSAAVSRCMSHGLPVIVNAHGTMAELDQNAVWMLPDEFDDIELVNALEKLWSSPQERHNLGKQARQHIREFHTPDICARLYTEAIDFFHKRTVKSLPMIIQRLTEDESFKPSESELLQLSIALGRNHPLPRLNNRLYLDITATRCHDLKTGIERVARALTVALLSSPPNGYRIEPVYLSCETGTWLYRHASKYTLELLECPTNGLEDEIIEPENGDLLVTLDLSGNTLIQAANSGLFNNYRNQGVSIYSVVFDLLPVLLPKVFPPGADQGHNKWLETISTFDGAICISKSVADDLRTWQNNSGLTWHGRRVYSIGWFHLGADLMGSAPTKGLPSNALEILSIIQSKTSFLMVGTIEPRKAYLEVLDTFDQLWHEAIDVNLVIVGKEGWKDLPDEMRRDIPETVACLRNHPQLNARLFWFEGISDEYLEKIYASSTCLIAASYGEGFGLPIIEAAKHNLPIIARDIPVFREVGGDANIYFYGEEISPNHSLSNAIKNWCSQYQEKIHPPSEKKQTITWQQSAQKLLDTVLNNQFIYRMVSKELKETAINEHLHLIHQSRLKLVRELLPPGETILDLGGANSPLHKMGYPHKFKKLYLIDLPPESRHDMYKEIPIETDCDSGEVVIKYGDMTELDGFADDSVDLVWSGQSIEHISLEAGKKMCEAVYRVLKPDGAFCLDTPNRLLTKIHTKDIGGGFIHPEHQIEYEPRQLRFLLEEAGFIVRAMLGICEMSFTAAEGEFDYVDFLYGKQISDQVDDCYIQYFYCTKSDFEK